MYNALLQHLAQKAQLLPGSPHSEEQLEYFAHLIVSTSAELLNSLEQYEGAGDGSLASALKEHFELPHTLSAPPSISR